MKRLSRVNRRSRATLPGFGGVVPLRFSARTISKPAVRKAVRASDAPDKASRRSFEELTRYLTAWRAYFSFAPTRLENRGALLPRRVFTQPGPETTGTVARCRDLALAVICQKFASSVMAVARARATGSLFSRPSVPLVPRQAPADQRLLQLA
jgi:hypothetical protein